MPGVTPFTGACEVYFRGTYTWHGGGTVVGCTSSNGSGGDDQLVGGPGKDRLCGGVGTDRLYGGLDDDGLLGNGGADIVWGTRDETLRTAAPNHEQAATSARRRRFATARSSAVADSGKRNLTVT